MFVTAADAAPTTKQTAVKQHYDTEEQIQVTGAAEEATKVQRDAANDLNENLDADLNVVGAKKAPVGAKVSNRG